MLAPRWPNMYCEVPGSGYCQMMLRVEGDFRAAGAGVGVWTNLTAGRAETHPAGLGFLRTARHPPWISRRWSAWDRLFFVPFGDYVGGAVSRSFPPNQQGREQDPNHA